MSSARADASASFAADTRPLARGLHSSAFRLNMSAFYGTGVRSGVV